ncbi:MAG TPA: outer membrane beta-barrel protein [Spirochaetota bacterium]|nr:outer membrane beta-barrel protein [Spirochaetota bacterium]
MNKQTLSIVFLAVAMVAAVPVFAVEREAGMMQLGGSLSLGVSSADATVWSGPSVGWYLDGDPTLWGDASIDPGAAGGLGFSFRYFLTDALALSTGLHFVAKSFTVVYPARTAVSDLELECTAYFATVPLGLRYVADIFYAGGGLYYGMAGDMDTETTVGGFTVEDTLSIDDDFGFYVELGVDVPLGERLSLDLGARYERGLTTIYDEDDVVTDIKTRALFFGAGLSYLL